MQLSDLIEVTAHVLKADPLRKTPTNTVDKYGLSGGGWGWITYLACGMHLAAVRTIVSYMTAASIRVISLCWIILDLLIVTLFS